MGRSRTDAEQRRRNIMLRDSVALYSCPQCGSIAGSKCLGEQGTPMGRPHFKRREVYRRAQERQTPTRAKAQPVTVRFVCPICSGPHARADHPQDVEGEDVTDVRAA